MKKIVCLLLAAALTLGLAACGMVSDRVIAVEKAIGAIGPVSLDSAETIAEARRAFDRLPEKEKKNVSNARALVAAEEELRDLQDNATVTELIDAIWALRDITPASAEQIEALQARYDALGEKLQARVSNSGRLQQAREILAVSEQLAALDTVTAGLKDLAARLRENTADSAAEAVHVLAEAEEKIARAREACEALGPELQPLLGNAAMLTDAEVCRQAALWQLAEKYFGEWEMESALEWYRQLPAYYRETGERITAAEDFLRWESARTELAGKWIWDGVNAEGPEGKSCRADFPELTIRELEPDGNFAGIRFADRRLLYVEIVPASPKKTEMKQTLLNGLHELRPKSFTAANIESYLHLDDHLEGGRQFYGGDIPTDTGPWEGVRLALYGGIRTHGTSGGSSWDHLLRMKIFLQDDGRLRVEYYVREMDKVTDPNASPAMTETVVFYYDRK